MRFASEPLTINHFNYIFETDSFKDKLFWEIKERDKMYYWKCTEDYIQFRNPSHQINQNLLDKYDNLQTTKEGIIRIDSLKRLSREQLSEITWLETYSAHSPRLPWKKYIQCLFGTLPKIDGVHLTITVIRQTNGNVNGVIIDCSNLGEVIDDENNLSLLPEKIEDKILHHNLERMIFDSYRIMCSILCISHDHSESFGDIYDVELTFPNIGDYPETFDSKLVTPNVSVSHQKLIVHYKGQVMCVKLCNPWFRCLKKMDYNTYTNLFEKNIYSEGQVELSILKKKKRCVLQ